MTIPANRKPPLAAWIQRERKNKDWKPKDVAERLSAMNLPVSEATVKVWESNANRRPSIYNLDGLEQIFGSPAPTGAAGDTLAVPVDLQPLLDQLTDYAKTVNELLRQNAALMAAAGIKPRPPVTKAELQAALDKFDEEPNPGAGTPSKLRSVPPLPSEEPPHTDLHETSTTAAGQLQEPRP